MPGTVVCLRHTEINKIDVSKINIVHTKMLWWLSWGNRIRWWYGQRLSLYFFIFTIWTSYNNFLAILFFCNSTKLFWVIVPGTLLELWKNGSGWSRKSRCSQRASLIGEATQNQKIQTNIPYNKMMIDDVFYEENIFLNRSVHFLKVNILLLTIL